MNSDDSIFARVLAEILRIQRWAAGDAIPASRIFGLMHGFETELRQERESFGIDESTQRRVEDILEDVERGTQSTDGPSIKDRLHRDKIDETDAHSVMQLCLLQSRFTEGIRLIADGNGSVFSTVVCSQHPTQNWTGALHYIELVDNTEGAHKKLHAIYTAAIPRIGEFVTPQGGSTMEVVGVEHVAIVEGDDESISRHCLVPHVILKVIDEGE